MHVSVRGVILPLSHNRCHAFIFSSSLSLSFLVRPSEDVTFHFLRKVSSHNNISLQKTRNLVSDQVQTDPLTISLLVKNISDGIVPLLNLL